MIPKTSMYPIPGVPQEFTTALIQKPYNTEKAEPKLSLLRVNQSNY